SRLYSRSRDDGGGHGRRRALGHPRHHGIRPRHTGGQARQGAPERCFDHAAHAARSERDGPVHRSHDEHRARRSRCSKGSTAAFMKITDIRFGILRVPLKTPFKTALRTVDKIEDIVVMITTDTGQTGYGEAPATAVITGDTHGSIVEAIRHYIWPRIAGHDVANLNQLTRLIQGAMEKNLSAKAAVEIALYDLWGQLYGAPLYKLLGGGDPLITTDITISVDYIDKMVADSLA